MGKSDKVKLEVVYKSLYSLEISVDEDTDSVLIEDSYNGTEVSVPISSLTSFIKALQDIADAVE